MRCSVPVNPPSSTGLLDGVLASNRRRKSAISSRSSALGLLSQEEIGAVATTGPRAGLPRATLLPRLLNSSMTPLQRGRIQVGSNPCPSALGVRESGSPPLVILAVSRSSRKRIAALRIRQPHASSLAVLRGINVS